MTARQMEGESVRLLAHPATDLDEAEPQGVELQAGPTGPDEQAAGRVEPPVGGGVPQQADLVGPEGRAAQAIGEPSTPEAPEPPLRPAPRHDAVRQTRR